jgi:biopolymer transport protein ExbD
MMESVLLNTSVLRPKAHKAKKSIVADLLLTALIDAFSILVIFLLMNFSSTGEILFIGKGTELPKAHAVEPLERTLLVKVETEKIYVEDKEVALGQLVQRLVDARKNGQQETITLQADRRLKYDFISQIVQAANHAGISQIKFAVMAK